MRELRSSLFGEAVDRRGLADKGEGLVQRRKSSGRTLKEKHVEDSWLLVGTIKKGELVPCSLLKNRNRAKYQLMKSQARLRGEQNAATPGLGVADCTKLMKQRMQLEMPTRLMVIRPGVYSAEADVDRPVNRATIDTEGDASHVMWVRYPVLVSRMHAVFRCTVVESINALRDEVSVLRSELRQFKKVGVPAPARRIPVKMCVCTLCVRILGRGSEAVRIGKS